MFYRIVTSALFAGFAAGLIAGLLQLVFLQPHLLFAEMFESGVLTHDPIAGSLARDGGLSFDPMRDGVSLLFSALTYTGYSLMFVAAMALADERGHVITPRLGIIWGVAGFITVQFAPSIGLPPQLPGLSAADMVSRQIWWFSTVAATGVALGLIAFGRSWMMWGLAILLLLAPHVIGAPEPERYLGSVPPELASAFASGSMGVGMAAWVILGLLAAHFWRAQGDV